MDTIKAHLPHYKVATLAPGKPGFVVSPHTGETLDVRGIRNGAVVKDPTAPKGERMYFIMPSAADQTPSPLNDPTTLNEYARSLLTAAKPSAADVVAAEKLSAAALEICDNNPDLRAEILDTNARVMYLLGKGGQAIELQEEAVKTCKDATLRASLVRTLESYKQGKLPDLTD